MCDWQEFGKEPLEGVYWVRGTYPEYDIDVDAYGRTVGVETGACVEYVSLVALSYDPSPHGIFEAAPVARWETGDFDHDYGITHYLPLEKPAFAEKAA